MDMSILTNLGPFGLPPMSIHRFTVEEYHRMVQAGVLNEDHRVELLEGWVVSKMAHNPTHDSGIDLVVGELVPVLPAEWFPRVQSAVTLEQSEPEPDIAVVRGPRGRYAGSHPRPADIGLLIEVSDSTLQNDRNVKGPVYAQARIPIYWILNLPERRVEVRTEPSGPDSSPCYHQLRIYGKDESLPVILDGKEVGQIAVNKLLP